MLPAAFDAGPTAPTLIALKALLHLGISAVIDLLLFFSQQPARCWTSFPLLQVAVELLRLTEEHGIDSWVSPTLNNKPYSIAGVSRWMKH